MEENRYVDPDYRSEYSAFWSQRFPTRPAFGRRLHFFRRLIRDEQLASLDPNTAGFVGYSTLKPITPGRVGRTVLAPPPRRSFGFLTGWRLRMVCVGVRGTSYGLFFVESGLDRRNWTRRGEAMVC